MRWFEKEIEIRYADTDQMGVVHHSVYPLYCEIGRTHVCEVLGLPYHQMEARDVFLMVADMYCRYKEPARYGESITVRTAISKLTRRLISFDYEITGRERRLLFTGNSRHIVTYRTEGPRSLPDDIMAVMRGGI
jgi:acyl-CoA thioester hydrolase